MKQGLRFIAASIVLLLLLYPAVRSLDMAQLTAALTAATWWPLACAGFLSVILCTGAGTLRLHVLLAALPGGTAPSLGGLYAIYLASSAAQNLMPAPAGEVLRTVHVARHHGYSLAGVTAAHVVEKVVDAIAIVLSVLALIAIGGMPRALATPAYLFLAATLLAAAAIFALARRQARPSDQERGAPSGVIRGVLSRISGFLRRTVDGLRPLRSPRTWLAAIAWSLLSEAANMMTVSLVVGSLGQSLPLSGLVAVVVTARLSGVVPTTPGQFGVQEGGVALVLGAFGVEPGRAMAAALLYRAVHFVPTTLAGVLVLQRLTRLPVRPPVPPAA